MTAEAKVKNVHQRKLAVMAKCAAIVPDKTHPAHKFQYVSIQTVSNHLRKFLVEEGLDYVPSVTDGVVVVELINADNPDDKIVTSWPVVDGDKGYAYSVKYPLVRMFLIGDGEENDEAEMANRSATVARPAPPRPAAPASQPNSGYRRPEAPVASPRNAPGAVTRPAGTAPVQDALDKEWAESLGR